jgi:hypothetical protein
MPTSTPTQNDRPHLLTEMAMPNPPSIAKAIWPKFSSPA